MVEHTPTPWRLHGLYPEEIYATIDNKRMQVADVSGACSSDQDVSNAAFIVMAANNHEALEAVRKAAYDYFMCAVQDEADDSECCITEQQHELAKALRDALRSASVGGAEK